MGGTACASFTAISDTEATCITPAGTAGTASVLVTTPSGTNTANTLFTYVASPPTLTGVSPASGPTTGGTVITLTGSNFTGATAITVGGTACTSFNVINASMATCVTPAGSAGPASVLITTPDGANAANELFTYVAVPPILSTVSPGSGPTTGGTVITLTGSNFTGATAITVGGTACASFTVISDTEATCITPAGNAGEASVLVTTPGGTNAANSLFSYSDPPGPPTAVSVSALDGQATVSFSAPASDGGAAITSYSVICTSNDGGASGNATGASSPIVVSGLTVGKTYTCQVTAINSIGPGTASIASMPFMVQLALPVPLLPQGALMLLALLLGLIAVTTLHRRAC